MKNAFKANSNYMLIECPQEITDEDYFFAAFVIERRTVPELLQLLDKSK